MGTKKIGNNKIVVIGAGSAEFGSQSLYGIMQTEGLHGFELHLVDIDQDKLGLITRLAERLNRELGADMQIFSTMKREEALEDAGFIILSIAIEREELWLKDYELALQHGITHYAENGGPAAFTHACRNMAAIGPILEDIQRLCPNAVLLNFTNPMQRICTAIHKLSEVQIMGICHQITFGYFILGVIFQEELGLSFPKDLRFQWTDEGVELWFSTAAQVAETLEIVAAGINHFTWMLAVKERSTGTDLYPDLIKKAPRLPETFEPLTQELFRIFEVMPVPGDCHLTEYVPYTSDRREKTWQRYDIQFYDLEWGKRRREEGLLRIREVVDGKENIEVLRPITSERAEILIDGIANNRHLYEEALNIPNRGYITNLPDGAMVEVPGIITSEGPSGLVVGELPESIAELCRRQISINELTVEAFQKGDRRLVHQLFAIDPMIQDPQAAVNLADAYLKLYKDYLPSFT
jgi:alpha-galactosidase